MWPDVQSHSADSHVYATAPYSEYALVHNVVHSSGTTKERISGTKAAPDL